MRKGRVLTNVVLVLTGLVVTACGGRGRVLIVNSEPADAEVCIKGRAQSEYFSNSKSCIGTTPLEVEKVTVTNPDGEKHQVTFKDVESDKEKFYVVVSRPGYVSQALEVPEWEHHVSLRSEIQNQAIQPVAAPMAAPASPIQPASAVAATPRGSVKIQTEPMGALVYINDTLKGNTPFTYEGDVGIVRLKLELEGFKTQERALTIEGDKALDLNFKLSAAEGAARLQKSGKTQ